MTWHAFQKSELEAAGATGLTSIELKVVLQANLQSAKNSAVASNDGS